MSLCEGGWVHITLHTHRGDSSSWVTSLSLPTYSFEVVSFPDSIATNLKRKVILSVLYFLFKKNKDALSH